MNAKDPRPLDPPSPRKRFRIRKLEERIAPKRGGSKGSGASGSGGTSVESGSIVGPY